MSTSESVIYLCSCALNNKTPDPALVKEMDLDAVYTFAERHMISAIVAMALESAGFKDKRSENAIGKAIRKAIIFQNALQEISARMEKAQINFVPLKGSVLKEYYPKFGMREMSDIDILIDADRAEEVKQIMEELRFTTFHFGGAGHDVYHKEPVLNVEIHKNLAASFHENLSKEYYQDYRVSAFSPEDFYIFLIAHEYKHYSGSGTGLRSLMDTYVYTKSVLLDSTYISGEMEKLGLAEFEQSNRQLSKKLFESVDLTEEEREQLDYILSSGTYGTIHHRVDNTIRKNNWSKLDYMASRFFVPIKKSDKRYDAFANQYPLFYKHKILLPILPFYRTIRAMKAGRFKSEAKALKKADHL